MKIYLVGGAVRDQLLGLPVKDRDWIVVGADPATLLSLGYQQVGKDFPVFLNPKTKEEYALARTERKSSTGYTGFICDFSPTITLEQDLIRRDLTINAMAQSEDGEIIDPYGGKQDLENRILRHISPAFSEDPLRVLRVARFAARYHSLGFKIASETLALMAELAQSGELQHLTAERVWLETEKALNEKNPEIYFETLHKTGALSVLFSEIDALHGVPNPVKHHPEVDSFIHTMLVLKQAVNLTENNPILNKSAVRFAAICHDLGKALTPQNILPHHYGHEQAGIKPTRSLCKRLKVPSYFQELAELTCEFHTHIHKAFELRAETVITLFNRFDVWRKSQRFQEFLQVCLADTRGRTGFENKDYPQIDYINQLLHAANEVDVQQVIADGFEKQAIKNELTKRRILAVKQTKTNYPTN
ncbi:multifunctional CCA addition/repair protein [Haemophilus influenzae]|uniref:Multifunctional CCA protein n=2 Tax=Haemophilus influenzae TaxID=727 RepID=CCA_HAEIG|nr:multifunctional CCA addition/repair protein [Haemophilus influenzae]A5UJ23.1 RecName: Full=Multifunctional CCA protein; Includes: RecName: Full=CCA-adding enzyme; AltName: Full=CCA tRNA nucleotidyltransferase; AltName: Full=tRNA CCA-pyrophosphorylase; AltName: Full=tRNA adenylyl-/cytidylyl-transferase; AltName: Full=tRNA nucleotidyltransferase; AltName: Full=tRNA-NT; Includes: RecName: Full=2'-nucleotidase; Includes: RecName: Full=2',3'-cyclic phosphodiesterase; Includes: RecName: Full=Phosphat